MKPYHDDTIKLKLSFCLDKPFCPSLISWNGQNGLKMVRKMSRMNWLYKFRSDIKSWDLKILYRDFESWKKMVEKKWNGMEWLVGLESWIIWNNIEWNRMV